MLHTLAVSWASKLNRHVQRGDTDYKKMVLGMEILLHNIPKLVLLVAVALFFGILPQTAITWFSFACIRRYASGLHANNSIICTVMTLLMFAAVPYLLQGIHFSERSLVLAFIPIVLALYRFAPADTAARPILGKKKRAKLKLKALAASGCLLALTLVLRNESFYGLVAAGAIYAVITVLPISYMVLGRSFNNYEQYE